MTVIAFASIKGSPGVTTAATAIAASWPRGRKVLLVEADPFGGDLAPRHGVSVTGGLASLFAAARRTLTPDAVWDHVHQLPGGLPVLFGLTNVHQAVANEKAWPGIAKALCDLDADVVVDAGRLLPQFAGGIRDVLERADALVVLCEPTLEAIVHLRDALPGLFAEMHSRRLLVVPAGSVGYSREEIGKTLQVEVGPPMPDDPNAAAALANKRNVKKLERTRLLKWAATVVMALGIEELGIEEPCTDESDIGEPTPVESSATEVDIEPLIEQVLEDIDTPTLSYDATVGAEPVGAGSNWEATR